MIKYDIAFWGTKREATYRSEIIDTSTFPNNIRIIFRHNKLKKKGDNRPSYIGTVVSCDNDEKSSDHIYRDISRLKQLIKEANTSSSEIINSADSRERADDLWKKIIEEVENLTEEKIEIKVW